MAGRDCWFVSGGKLISDPACEVDTAGAGGISFPLPTHPAEIMTIAHGKSFQRIFPGFLA
jgi:hypothetical protein